MYNIALFKILVLIEDFLEKPCCYQLKAQQYIFDNTLITKNVSTLFGINWMEFHCLNSVLH